MSEALQREEFLDEVLSYCDENGLWPLEIGDEGRLGMCDEQLRELTRAFVGTDAPAAVAMMRATFEPFLGLVERLS